MTATSASHEAGAVKTRGGSEVAGIPTSCKPARPGEQSNKEIHQTSDASCSSQGAVRKEQPSLQQQWQQQQRWCGVPLRCQQQKQPCWRSRRLTSWRPLTFTPLDPAAAPTDPAGGLINQWVWILAADRKTKRAPAAPPQKIPPGSRSIQTCGHNLSRTLFQFTHSSTSLFVLSLWFCSGGQSNSLHQPACL